ncbi:MAG: hypothetical protein ACOC5R_05055, partial [Elusimicrobiota bacterium]
MSIKRYSTFCKNDASKKRKKNTKIKKIKSPVKIGLFGIMFSLLILVGINMFFNLPFMSLGLEEKSGEKNEEAPHSNSETKILSEVNLAEDCLEENTVQGLEEIKDELDRLALQNEEQLSEKELNLKYQKEYEDIKTVTGKLNYGETLYQYLVKNGISPTEVLRLQEKVYSAVDISRLNEGTKFSVYHNAEGEIVQFDYQPNQLDVYHIKIPGNEMGNIEVSKDEIFREIVCLEGEIDGSLYQAMLDYSNSGQLAVQLAEIFAWDIDFLTEC